MHRKTSLSFASRYSIAACIGWIPIEVHFNVEHEEPKEFPILMMLAPASARKSIPSFVQTFPAIMIVSGYFFLTYSTIFFTFKWCPWFTSMMMFANPLSASQSAMLKSASCMPMDGKKLFMKKLSAYPFSMDLMFSIAPMYWVFDSKNR